MPFLELQAEVTLVRVMQPVIEDNRDRRGVIAER